MSPFASKPRVVEHVLIADLKSDPTNVRRHPKAQISKLMRSIEAFDLPVPILVDEANAIIDGHAVVEAAKAVGRSEVPVLRVENLSKAKKCALRLALNRLAEDAVWDREHLAVVFEELLQVDVDIEMTGFEITEIDLILEDHRLQSSEQPDSEDALPATDTRSPPVSQSGDLWVLGRHQLICGDARDGDSYRALLGEERARMAFADPPYNVRVADIGNRGRVKHPEFAMASGEMTRPEYVSFLSSAFREMAAISMDGAVHFICTDSKHLTEMTTATEEAYDEHLTLAVWNKVAGGMGGLYRNQHELVFVEKVGKAPILNNVQLGRHGRNRTNVWTYRGLASFGKGRLQTLALHPTVKPVALVADAILDVSKRNDIVLNPFAGSGTTIIAAEKTGRRAHSIEFDPHYCDVAIRRWETYAGKAAIHAETGLSFEDIEAERRSECNRPPPASPNTSRIAPAASPEMAP